MSDAPVSLTSSGPPETVLDPEPAAIRERLAAADAPTSLAGWATLGDLARDDVEAYACYRVGYHRGLDRLRQSGWRGSGYVRWEHEANRGFLRALDGLRGAAAAI